MNKQDIINIATDFTENSEYNYITKENAISEDIVGMRIFDPPVFAFGNADDEYFEKLKSPSAVGEHFRLPKEWLPQAKTVISFFLPFTETVRKSNRENRTWPSSLWLHGRIEGQAFLNRLCLHLNSVLISSGYGSVVPSLDHNFWSKAGFSKASSDPDENTDARPTYTSNWSERHVAYVCGLGTFGLSKGLITKKGMAGRLGSLVTELYLPPDKREYSGIYEYCSMCGACVKRCPANAISVSKGKDHDLCSQYLNVTAEKFKPRYGCGKCQTKVPCESCIPVSTSPHKE